MPEKRHRPEEITSKLREADVLIRRRFPALLPPPIHLSPISSVFAQCCVSLTILSLPPRDSGPIQFEIQWICIGAKYAFNFRVRKAWRQPNLLIWRGGDRMTLWLISIAGAIVGVIAADTPITDPKVKLVLGVVLLCVAIHLQCGSGKRD